MWNPPGVEHRDSFETPGGRFLSVSFMPPVSSARDSAQSRLLALGVLCLCALVVYGLVDLGTVTGF